MSQENVEIVRRVFATADEKGWDAVVQSPEFHDDAELTFKAGPQAGGHQGREQIQAVFDDILGAFESWITEPLEFRDSEDQVVTVVNNRFRPSGATGGEFEYRNGQIWTIREEKIVSVVQYPTREEALEAAGLRE